MKLTALSELVPPAIYVDMGTTNTRVWCVSGGQIRARLDTELGARTQALGGSESLIVAGLRPLIKQIQEITNAWDKFERPEFVAAAGMIGSSLGLSEVPHVVAPAGINELGKAACWFVDERLTDLPIMIAPGVKTVPGDQSPDRISELDVMRGEETLCLGLTATKQIEPPCSVLNLGSHWKVIEVDSESRIKRSTTSLTGELLEAIRRQTILADSVSSNWPQRLDLEWVNQGVRQQRQNGFSRSLFLTRLLEPAEAATAEQRFAFLVGVVLGSDLDSMIASDGVDINSKLAICGKQDLVRVCHYVLDSMGIESSVISDKQTEIGFLSGLGNIFSCSLQLRRRGMQI